MFEIRDRDRFRARTLTVRVYDSAPSGPAAVERTRRTRGENRSRAYVVRCAETARQATQEDGATNTRRTRTLRERDRRGDEAKAHARGSSRGCVASGMRSLAVAHRNATRDAARPLEARNVDARPLRGL